MARPIDDISEALATAISKAIVNSEDVLKAIAEAGGKAAGPTPLQNAESLVKIITSVITSLPIVGDIVGLATEPLDVIDNNTSPEGRAFGMGWIFGSIGVELLQPVIEDVQHYVNDLFQSGIFDPDVAAQLQAKGLITDAQGRSEAAGGNLDGDHYDTMVDAAQERPAVGQVIDAWLKDLVTEADVDAALQHHTIPQFWWGPIKALSRLFLSPADLALANLRGEMDTTTMLGYAKQLGMDANDMQVLINNTGEPPGIQEMLFLWRRQLISKDRLERAIRQSRVRDEWIDAVELLAHEPMSTADAARAVVEGYMSPDEGAVIADQNGLDAAHWPLILESWGRPLSHEQMLTLMHRGQATRDQVVQAMKESDIKDKYIDQAIDLGRALIPERLIVQALSKSVITHDAAHTALTERGYNDDDAEVLLKLGTSERTTAAHALSRTDILNMYGDALLTHAAAQKHLEALGFSAGDAGSLLDLQDVKAQAATRRTTQRAVEAALKAKHITQQEAINQLEAAGIAHNQASNLVDEWTQQRGAVVRTLTEAQTIKAGGAGLLSEQETYDRMRGLGYNQQDALILMELGGMPPGSAISFNT